MYSSYTAASFARKHELAAKHGVNLEGAVTWAFEFEDQPYFAGQRVLSTNGIALPVLNVFRMFAKMSGQRITVESDGAVSLEAMLKSGVREKPDVTALASLDGDKLCILLWHYHDDDLPGSDADVELSLEGLPANRRVSGMEHYVIDSDHSNAFTAWKKMGSPQQPTGGQRAALMQAGQLAKLDDVPDLQLKPGKAILRFPLPRQAVSLLVVTLTESR
jgi:xylan 1,4-beta-xylosidase